MPDGYKFIGCNISPSMSEVLDRAARDSDMNRSEFIRAALDEKIKMVLRMP